MKNKLFLIFQNMEMLVFTTKIQHTANMENVHIHIYIYTYTEQESCNIQKVKILKINLDRIHWHGSEKTLNNSIQKCTKFPEILKAP